MICNNEYGNFRTKTFAEVFYKQGTDSEVIFSNSIKNTGIPLKITEENLTTLFYLLYARYGNSHITNNDENQFLYKVASTIFMYGPSWEKRLEMQDKLHDLTDEDLIKGSLAVYNIANAPGTITDGELDQEGKLTYLSGQNTTAYRKNKVEAYATLTNLMEKDVTKEFIDKFANFFLKIVEPYDPLWYRNDVEEEL